MMTQEQMTQKVQEELEHIPQSDLSQNLLRTCYQQMRMHSLSKGVEKKQSPFEILQKCIDLLRKEHPEYKFNYDREFFSLGG